MRRDIRVPNESDAFVFTSASLRGRGLSPREPEWAASVARGDLLPLGVESEDDANVRVVVDEPLTPPERAEWVGVVRAGLRVPDGKLVLAGGTVYVLEATDWAAEHARIVDVPGGDYHATLYCHVPAPNGRWCAEAAGSKEPLGAWFRRTRAGEAMPAWLHNLCVNDPSLDPGHSAQWKRAKLRTKGSAVVDFLLHLEKTAGPLAVPALGEEDVFMASECRRPEPFPLGVPALGLDPDDDEEPESEPPPPPAKEPPAASGTLQPVPGGPVGVPVVKLARLARLAWMCQLYAQPALQITWPHNAPRFDDVEDATAAVKGCEMHVSFEDTGQPSGALQPLGAVARQLASATDGVVIELFTFRPRGKDAKGVHRYRGAVQGGVWQIDAASPAVNAPTLTEALALAEALESGRKLAARDEEEAARIEARVTKVLADHFGSNGLQRTGTEVALRRRDPALFTHVVARVFWMRYSRVWPLQDEDAVS